jgi:prepilin-type N-terminal cleavage/methylation domain-containing protein
MRSRGFTIVELLIVIVVIAILAAISIVAYNGIQSRAYNASLLAGINSYKKAIRLYAVDNGVYPSAFPACLNGQASLGASSNQCSDQSTTKPTFDDAIAPYIGSQPNLEAKVVTGSYGGTSYQFLTTGQYNTYGGKHSLYYWLPGANEWPADGSTVAAGYTMQASVMCIYTFPDL